MNFPRLQSVKLSFLILFIEWCLAWRDELSLWRKCWRVKIWVNGFVQSFLEIAFTCTLYNLKLCRFFLVFTLLIDFRVCTFACDVQSLPAGSTIYRNSSTEHAVTDRLYYKWYKKHKCKMVVQNGARICTKHKFLSARPFAKSLKGLYRTCLKQLNASHVEVRSNPAQKCIAWTEESFKMARYGKRSVFEVMCIV